MKLRIKGNSIRLRLTRNEVESFSKTGLFSDMINFPGSSSLTYCLEATDQKQMSVEFVDRVIKVSVPRETANDWTQTESVGFSGDVELSNGETLKFLVEKDFACLKPRVGEDESDAYPHPNPENC